MGAGSMGARGSPLSAGYMHMTTPFTATPITGPTYTDLAREVDRLKADNAALLSVAKYFAEMLDDVVMNGSGADLGWMRPERAAAMLATIRAPHPGSAILDELESLRKQVEALKQGQRSASEARQRAFLELAEDLAAMTPEKRDSHIRRIIDNAGENRP